MHPQANFAQMKFEYAEDGSMAGRKYYNAKNQEIEMD